MHGVVAPHGERVYKHVISVMSSTEPEPNRSLRSGKPGSPPPKSASPSPPHQQASAKSRVTHNQHAVATRKLEQFMNSTMVRPVPVDQHFAATPHHHSASTWPCIGPSSESHLLYDVLHGFHALLEMENRSGSLDSHGLGLAALPQSFAPSATHLTTLDQNVNCSGLQHKHHNFEAAYVSGSEEESEPQSGLMSMPREIILAIIGHVGDNQTLLQISRVCKPLREFALIDSIWTQELDRLASECCIQREWLNRLDSTPKYLRWCAIMRWYAPYQEAKRLLNVLTPENRAATNEKDLFEEIFNSMMPNVSPWSPSAYYLDEIQFTLPTSVSVLPTTDSNALHICIELESGAFRHELFGKGLAPELQFMLYDPVGAHPAVTCLSKDIYHPLLHPSSNRLLISFPARSPSMDPSFVVKDMILQIRDLFTRFDSIVSDFLL